MVLAPLLLTKTSYVDATAIEYGLDESRPHVRTPSEWTWLSERQNGIAMGNNKLVGLPTA